MTTIVLNLLLALVWTAITGTFTAENFALGLLVGFVALAATRSVPGLPSYSRRSVNAALLGLYVGYELVLSNMRVALDILRGPASQHPAVIDVPLDVRTDVEITLLAAAITLTPGTTAIGVSPDQRTMYVHLTNLRGNDVASARASIKAGFERRVLEVFR